MVVDDIYDDGDTLFVGRFDKKLKGIRSAVNAFDGKRMSRIVSPRKIACKLHDRHHFDGIDTQFLQVRNFFNGAFKRPRVPLLFNVKGADVHFVNDKLVPRGHGEGFITPLAPIEGLSFIDNSVARCVRHFPGIRVDTGERTRRTVDQISVLVSFFASGTSIDQ